jgi:hypothetical protein
MYDLLQKYIEQEVHGGILSINGYEVDGVNIIVTYIRIGEEYNDPHVLGSTTISVWLLLMFVYELIPKR